MTVSAGGGVVLTAAANVQLREFNELVDSSLRIADRRDMDDQSVKGESWILRACRWVYMPFRFRVAYHQLQGQLQVVYFQYQRLGSYAWRSIRTTEDYRKVLKEADTIRRAQP